MDNYATYFNEWKGEKLVGHAPVNASFYAEKAAKRIYEFNSSMKLIMILRNPIERAYSHYWYCHRNGLEDESFEEALEREEALLKLDKKREEQCLYYMSHGFYYEQLIEYLKFFNRSQLLILYYDDFKKNPEKTLKEIYDFFGLEEIRNEGINRKYNVASMPKFRIIHKLIYKDNIIKDAYKRVVPERFREYARRTIIGNILKKNLAPFEYVPMKEETREFLQNIFRGPNKELEELLGKDFSNWK